MTRTTRDRINRIKYNWAFQTHRENELPALELIQVKHTTRACMGGWTHATWLVFEGRRKRMAPWQIGDQDALHAYYCGPLPIVATLGKGYYLALRTLAD